MGPRRRSTQQTALEAPNAEAAAVLAQVDEVQTLYARVLFLKREGRLSLKGALQADHLNPWRILRLKLLIEQAGAAALAGGDSARTREVVLRQLSAVLAEAVAAVRAQPSWVLLRLMAELLQLLAGCSGPASGACLDAWQAFLEGPMLLSQEQLLALPHPYVEVARQDSRVRWGMDPPDSSQHVALETLPYLLQFMETVNRAMDRGRQAFLLAAQQPERHPWLTPAALQRVLLLAAEEGRPRERSWRLHSGGGAGSGASTSSSTPLLPGPQQQGQQGQEALAAAEVPFLDSARDRSLLRRLGQQAWLREELRRRLQARFAGAPRPPQPVAASGPPQLEATGMPLPIELFLHRRTLHREKLLAESAVLVAEVTGRVLPQLERDVAEALRPLLERGETPPAVAFLPPDGAMASHGSGGSSSGSASGSESAQPRRQLLSQAEFDAAFEQAALDAQGWQDQAWLRAMAAHAPAMDTLATQLDIAELMGTAAEVVASGGQRSPGGHQDTSDPPFIGLWRGQKLLAAAAAVEAGRPRGVAAAQAALLQSRTDPGLLLEDEAGAYPHLRFAMRRGALDALVGSLAGFAAEVCAGSGGVACHPGNIRLHQLNLACWGSLLHTPGSEREQVKQGLVDACLLGFTLLVRRCRLDPSWWPVVQQYLQAVRPEAASDSSGDAEQAPGGEPASQLSALASLPLTALVPLHAACCWLVGESFADVADLGAEAQSLSAIFALLTAGMQTAHETSRLLAAASTGADLAGALLTSLQCAVAQQDLGSRRIRAEVASLCRRLLRRLAEQLQRLGSGVHARAHGAAWRLDRLQRACRLRAQLACREAAVFACGLPLQRPLLAGLLRHCLTHHWVEALERDVEEEGLPPGTSAKPAGVALARLAKLYRQQQRKLQAAPAAAAAAAQPAASVDAASLAAAQAQAAEAALLAELEQEEEAAGSKAAQAERKRAKRLAQKQRRRQAEAVAGDRAAVEDAGEEEAQQHAQLQQQQQQQQQESKEDDQPDQLARIAAGPSAAAAYPPAYPPSSGGMAHGSGTAAVASQQGQQPPQEEWQVMKGHTSRQQESGSTTATPNKHGSAAVATSAGQLLPRTPPQLQRTSGGAAPATPADATLHVSTTLAEGGQQQMPPSPGVRFSPPVPFGAGRSAAVPGRGRPAAAPTTPWAAAKKYVPPGIGPSAAQAEIASGVAKQAPVVLPGSIGSMQALAGRLSPACSPDQNAVLSIASQESPTGSTPPPEQKAAESSSDGLRTAANRAAGWSPMTGFVLAAGGLPPPVQNKALAEVQQPQSQTQPAGSTSPGQVPAALQNVVPPPPLLAPGRVPTPAAAGAVLWAPVPPPAPMPLLPPRFGSTSGGLWAPRGANAAQRGGEDDSWAAWKAKQSSSVGSIAAAVLGGGSTEQLAAPPAGADSSWGGSGPSSYSSVPIQGWGWGLEQAGADASAALGSTLQGSWRAPLGALAAQRAQQLALQGLRNALGEYNCFLNAVVQCLWRCAAFRQQVLGWLPSFYEAHPVVAALRRLFEQLGQQEAAAAGAGSATAAAASRRVVDPTQVRVALSGASERTFGLGEMNDAGEVLLTIYESIQAVEQVHAPSCSMRATMGLTVQEDVHCKACGRAAGMQAVHTQLAEQRRRGILGANTMGKRLRVLAEVYKSCDMDLGGCGSKQPVVHRLVHAPHVFSLQLTWPSHDEAPEDIGSTLRALEGTLALGEVYEGEAALGRRYRLRSLVGYYGAHYSAFVALPELGGEFALFDDTQVSRAGGWEAVVRKCEAGRIQPSVLFYEAEGLAEAQRLADEGWVAARGGLSAGSAQQTAGVSPECLCNPLWVLRIKLLIEQAAQAALEGGDSREGRREALRLLCKAQEQVVTALGRAHSSVLQRLLGELLQLTAGCSGPALMSTVRCMVAYWRRAALRPGDYMPPQAEVTGGDPRLAWGLDPAPIASFSQLRCSSGIRDAEAALVHSTDEYSQAAQRAVDAGFQAVREEAQQKGTARVAPSCVVQPSDDGQPGSGEQPADKAAFGDNERDRSLLRRLGQQRWLRQELRRRLAARFPAAQAAENKGGAPQGKAAVGAQGDGPTTGAAEAANPSGCSGAAEAQPAAVAGQGVASGAGQIDGATAEASADRLKQGLCLNRLLAACAAPVEEVVERVLPHMEPHVAEVRRGDRGIRKGRHMRCARCWSETDPPLGYLPPPGDAAAGAADAPTLLLSQEAFDAAFEEAVLSPEAWEAQERARLRAFAASFAELAHGFVPALPSADADANTSRSRSSGAAGSTARTASCAHASSSSSSSSAAGAIEPLPAPGSVRCSLSDEDARAVGGLDRGTAASQESAASLAKQHIVLLAEAQGGLQQALQGLKALHEQHAKVWSAVLLKHAPAVSGLERALFWREPAGDRSTDKEIIQDLETMVQGAALLRAARVAGTGASGKSSGEQEQQEVLSVQALLLKGDEAELLVPVSSSLDRKERLLRCTAQHDLLVLQPGFTLLPAELSAGLADRLDCLQLTALMPLHAACCWLVGASFADVADLGGRVQALLVEAERALELSGSSLCPSGSLPDAVLHSKVEMSIASAALVQIEAVDQAPAARAVGTNLSQAVTRAKLTALAARFLLAAVELEDSKCRASREPLSEDARARAEAQVQGLRTQLQAAADLRGIWNEPQLMALDMIITLSGPLGMFRDATRWAGAQLEAAGDTESLIRTALGNRLREADGAARAVLRLFMALMCEHSSCLPELLRGRRELQAHFCTVPLQRRLLEGLLRHCLADRWAQAAEEEEERERAAQAAAAAKEQRERAAAQAAAADEEERERAAQAAAAAEAALLAELEQEEQQAAVAAQRKAAQRRARKQRRQATPPATAASFAPAVLAQAEAEEKAEEAAATAATEQETVAEEAGTSAAPGQEEKEVKEDEGQQLQALQAELQHGMRPAELSSNATTAAPQPAAALASSQPGSAGKRGKRRSKQAAPRVTAERLGASSPAGQQSEAASNVAEPAVAFATAAAAAAGRSVGSRDEDGKASQQAQQAQQAGGPNSSSSRSSDANLPAPVAEASLPAQQPAAAASGRPGTPRAPQHKAEAQAAAGLGPLTPEKDEDPGIAAAAEGPGAEQGQSGGSGWPAWPDSRQSSVGSVPGLLGRSSEAGDDEAAPPLLAGDEGPPSLLGGDDDDELPPVLAAEGEEGAGWDAGWAGGAAAGTWLSGAAAGGVDWRWRSGTFAGAGQEWGWEEYDRDAWDQAGPSSADGASAAHGGVLQGSWRAPLGALAVQRAQQLALPGLRNALGEYNCFLNAVVQCLWRCAAFRQQVLGWPSSFFEAHPVVLALRRLFEQLGQQEAAAAGAGSAAAAAAIRRVVDPTQLRVALSGASERTFRLGEMNDAGEVLLTIYESIQAVEQAQHLPSSMEAVVGLPVQEGVYCPTCELASHKTSYTQYFYNAQASAAGMQELLARAMEQRRRCILGANTMGKRLKALAEMYKSCDDEKGGCGAKRPVWHRLVHAPHVFTLQLAWRSHSEAPEDIGAALRALEGALALGEVYEGEAAAGRRYRLRSMVGYYGAHYSAFVALPELGGEFALFDDTQVNRAGGWEAVVCKCEAGRIQPSVVFYEAEE
ncbi:hypothetical protein ABPG75_000262 [Micractinium tetrahymenae]